jgi:hypothetical protein
VGRASAWPVGEKGDEVNGRNPIGKTHRVIEILPVSRLRPPCPPDCEIGSLCPWCEDEVRAEALEWLRVLNVTDGLGPRWVAGGNPDGWAPGERVRRSREQS